MTIAYPAAVDNMTVPQGFDGHKTEHPRILIANELKDRLHSWSRP